MHHDHQMVASKAVGLPHGGSREGVRTGPRRSRIEGFSQAGAPNRARESLGELRRSQGRRAQLMRAQESSGESRRAQVKPKRPRRAQENTGKIQESVGELRRAQECPGKPKRAQESSGKPRRPQESLGEPRRPAARSPDTTPAARATEIKKSGLIIKYGCAYKHNTENIHIGQLV